MDAQDFRLPTPPSLYKSSVASVETQIAQPTNGLNARYTGYAAIAEDANLFTDYRPQCEKNIPAGQQYATHQWLQHNAEDIIKLSRQRQAAAVGAEYLNANTVPPPVAFVKCQTNACGYYPSSSSTTQIPTGIERDDKAPALFGTFKSPYRQTPPKPTQRMTTIYEGGRNSPRG